MILSGAAIAHSRMPRAGVKACCRGGGLAAGREARQQGVALLLVMIIFIVLYMVVYQLHFSTRMEEKIAAVRYGEVEAASALYSTGLYVMTLLVEDLKEDLAEQSGAGGGAGADPTAGGGMTARSIAGAPGVSGAPAGMDMGGGGQKVWHDYIRENIFLPNQQQIGDVSVKISIFDAEGRLDLNRLFDYVRVEEDEEFGRVSEEEGEGEGAPGSRREEILSRTRNRVEESLNRLGGADGAEEEMTPEEATSPETLAEDDLDSYEPEERMLEPIPSKSRAVVEMLTRVVEMTMQLNLDNGFFYEYEPVPSLVAQAIHDYVLERRTLDFNNRVLFTRELLNHPEISEQLFYGPYPPLVEGEEQYGDFVLRRDEYGDLESQYIYDEYFDSAAYEERRAEMAGLMEQFGSFADFPGIDGLSRLEANGLTRGMRDLPVALDEFGEELVLEPPQPIGLVDLFTTFSTGKINLNTVSAPVLYGLLMSLDPEEAWKVALDLRDYRNRFQEVEEEEGVERIGAMEERDLGQPRRQPPPEEDDPAYEDEFLAGAYQDMETNYFTSLEQIELIDGTEQDPDDLLRQVDQVERVDVEARSPLQRVVSDLQPLVVFGSTYFDVKLKAKTQWNRSVKIANLTLKRDVSRSLMEVVMWRDEQR